MNIKEISTESLLYELTYLKEKISDCDYYNESNNKSILNMFKSIVLVDKEINCNNFEEFISIVYKEDENFIKNIRDHINLYRSAYFNNLEQKDDFKINHDLIKQEIDNRLDNAELEV